jgi:hypothetical protein
MIDILFTLGQILCALAYVYGAYLVITHVASTGLRVPRRPEHDEIRPDPEENEIWKRYRHLDS